MNDTTSVTGRGPVSLRRVIGAAAYFARLWRFDDDERQECVCIAWRHWRRKAGHVSAVKCGKWAALNVIRGERFVGRGQGRQGGDALTTHWRSFIDGAFRRSAPSADPARVAMVRDWITVSLARMTRDQRGILLLLAEGYSAEDSASAYGRHWSYTYKTLHAARRIFRETGGA